MNNITNTQDQNEGEVFEETLLTAVALSKRWSVGTGHLANLRSKGSGIDYVKIGDLVRYRLSDVMAYEASRSVSTNSAA